jgi:hypothetical protein
MIANLKGQIPLDAVGDEQGQTNYANHLSAIQKFIKVMNGHKKVLNDDDTNVYWPGDWKNYPEENAASDFIHQDHRVSIEFDVSYM